MYLFIHLRAAKWLRNGSANTAFRVGGAFQWRCVSLMSNTLCRLLLSTQGGIHSAHCVRVCLTQRLIECVLAVWLACAHCTSLLPKIV